MSELILCFAGWTAELTGLMYANDENCVIPKSRSKSYYSWHYNSLLILYTKSNLLEQLLIRKKLSNNEYI